jgi:hypothetical protein
MAEIFLDVKPYKLNRAAWKPDSVRIVELCDELKHASIYR